MSGKLKKCEVCKNPFHWIDQVVIVHDELYHDGCVTLYPMGFFAMLRGEPLGETENEDGSSAYDVLDDGEYLEDEE